MVECLWWLRFVWQGKGSWVEQVPFRIVIGKSFSNEIGFVTRDGVGKGSSMNTTISSFIKDRLYGSISIGQEQHW